MKIPVLCLLLGFLAMPSLHAAETEKKELTISLEDLRAVDKAIDESLQAEQAEALPAEENEKAG